MATELPDFKGLPGEEGMDQAIRAANDDLKADRESFLNDIKTTFPIDQVIAFIVNKQPTTASVQIRKWIDSKIVKSFESNAEKAVEYGKSVAKGIESIGR